MNSKTIYKATFRILSAATLAFATACVLSFTGEAITPTMTIRGTMRVELGNRTTPSGQPTEVGRGHIEELNRTGILYDSNGDGQADLAYDTATGNYYEVRGIRGGGEPSSRFGPWLGDVNIALRPPVNPVASMRWGGDAEAMHRAFGLDTMQPGLVSANTVAVHAFAMGSDLLRSYVDLSVRSSTRFACGFVAPHQNLAYEIHYLPSAVPDGPWMVNHRVAGPLVDVARYLADTRGFQELELKSDWGSTVLKFTPATRALSLLVEGVLVGTTQL